MTWVAAAGCVMAGVSVALLAIAGEFEAPALAAHTSQLDAALAVGVAGAGGAWVAMRLGPGRTRTALLRLVMGLVGIGASLAAIEAGVRFTFRDVRSSADVRSYFATRALPARVNNVGFRDRDVGARRSDRYRIAVIGDSITWGQGIAEQERFSNLLQEYLGDGYEVFNFGIPGDNMAEHLRVLAHPVLDEIAPDFVLLQLYINDFELPEMERPRPRPLLPWTRLDRRLLRASAVYDMVTAKWNQVQEAAGMVETYTGYMQRQLGNPNSPAARRAFGMLREFIERARAAHVTVGTVLFPNPGLLGEEYPFEYIHDRVAQLGREEQVHSVDLRAAFSRYRDPRTLWVNPFDPHPNARANRRAAAAILDEFGSVWRQSSGVSRQSAGGSR